MKLTIDVQVVKVSESYIAGTTLGGFTLRGKRATDKAGAVRNLLWLISGNDSDDAALGLELAIDGTTMEDQLALDAGDDGSS